MSDDEKARLESLLAAHVHYRGLLLAVANSLPSGQPLTGLEAVLLTLIMRAPQEP